MWSTAREVRERIICLRPRPAGQSWKTRSSVDYATRARLVADVQFNSLEEWSRIRTQLGAVRAVDGQRGQGHYVDGPRKSFAGGAGIVSTAADYARFLEMVRNDGVLGGVRILFGQFLERLVDEPVGELVEQLLLRQRRLRQDLRQHGASGDVRVTVERDVDAFGACPLNPLDGRRLQMPVLRRDRLHVRDLAPARGAASRRSRG